MKFYFHMKKVFVLTKIKFYHYNISNNGDKPNTEYIVLVTTQFNIKKTCILKIEIFEISICIVLLSKLCVCAFCCNINIYLKNLN